MKKIPVVFILFITFSVKVSAQVIDDRAGKTYYYYDEETHKQLKEVFHHKDIIKIIPDKANYGSYKDTIVYLKHGPYSMYHENGELYCTGYYSRDKKDSTWKFYDIKGELFKTEKWKLGQQMH